MKSLNRIFVCIAALALMLTLATSIRAEDQPAAGGAVEVVVLDKDGKPAEGVTVRLTAPKQAAPQAQTKPADGAKSAPEPAAKTSPVATATTDKDGKAKLENVPAGNYNLAASLRGQGSARQKVVVKSGDSMKVELHLVTRAAKAASGA